MKELQEFFEPRGFTVTVTRVEDSVKYFDRLDVFDGDKRTGSFLFVDGKMMGHDEVDRLRNKPHGAIDALRRVDDDSDLYLLAHAITGGNVSPRWKRDAIIEKVEQHLKNK